MSEKKFLDLTGLSTIISKILNQCSSIYSLKERVVGKWTDGKKLYEITIAATKISGTDLEIDVSSLSIDVGFVYGGFLRCKEGTTYALERYEQGGVFARAELSVNKVKLRYKTSEGNYTNGDVSITLRYTKK